MPKREKSDVKKYTMIAALQEWGWEWHFQFSLTTKTNQCDCFPGFVADFFVIFIVKEFISLICLYVRDCISLFTVTYNLMYTAQFINWKMKWCKTVSPMYKNLEYTIHQTLRCIPMIKCVEMHHVIMTRCKQFSK